MAKYDLSTVELAVDGAHVAIVAARFNAELVGPLVEGALARLTANGLGAERVRVVHVPGAFEIPLAAARLAKSGRYEAVIAAGRGGARRHSALRICRRRMRPRRRSGLARVRFAGHLWRVDR